MVKVLYHFLEIIVEYAIFAFEIVGVLILVWAGIKGVYNYLKKNPRTGSELAEGMAMALQFKLGGEILRTVIIRELNEIFLVGGIIALRVALTALIRWELKNNKLPSEGEDTQSNGGTERDGKKEQGGEA